MLPFLRNKQVKSTGLISTIRKAEGGFADADSPQDQGNYGLESCARALIEAVKAEDSAKVAKALKDAFDVLESQPRQEGPDEEPAA